MANLSNINNKFIVTDGNNGRVLIGATNDIGATLFANHPSTTAPSLTFNAPAGQVFENEDLQIAFGLNNAVPYNGYMQTRFVSAPYHRNLAINPLGGDVGIGTNSPAKKLDVEGNIRTINTGGTVAAEIDVTSGSTWRLRSNPTSGTNNYGLDIIKGGAGTDVKMSIDSSGNVGIGTIEPDGKVHIFNGSNGATTVGTASDELILENDTDCGLTIRSAADATGVVSFASPTDHNVGQLYYNHDDDSMVIRTNDAIRTIIGSSGIMYIMGATASTNNSLQLQYNSTAGTAEIYSKSTGGNTTFEFYTSNSGTTTQKFNIGSSGDVKITTNGKFLQGVRNTNGNVIDMIGFGAGTDRLQIKGGASGGSESIAFFDTAGQMATFYNSNFGIGTTSPDAKLSLYNATEDVSINVNTGTGGSYPKKTGISFGAISTSLGGDLEFRGGAGIQAINTAASGNPTDLTFWTNSNGTPAERMRIDSSGNTTFAGDVIIENSLPIITLKSTDNTAVAEDIVSSIDFYAGDTSSAGQAVNAKILSYATDAFGRLGLQFLTGGNGAPNERMRIDSSGQISMTKSGADHNLIITNNTAGGDFIKCIGETGDDVFKFDSGGTGGEAVLLMFSDGVLKNTIQANGDTYFNNIGNFGIGTTSPKAKLDMDGDVNTTGYLANTLEFSTYFGSGTTVIATLNGNFEPGTTAVASIEYVGLYAYAGADNTLGLIMASTRRSSNNTAWSNVNDETVHVAGATSREPTFFWDNGLLKITVATSVQISCRIRITYHGSNTGLTRNHSA